MDEFERFCHSEYDRLVGSLSLFCGDGLVAQELAQEALMRACRDWEKVRKMNSPRAWMHTTGMNLARSHFRRKKIERRVIQKAMAGQTLEMPSTEDAVAMRRAVAALPSRQKRALVLRYYVDLPIPEVAAAMDCSLSTVKALVRKGLEGLRHSEGILLKEGADAS